MIDFWIFPLSTIWGAYQNCRLCGNLCCVQYGVYPVHNARSELTKNSLNLCISATKKGIRIRYTPAESTPVVQKVHSTQDIISNCIHKIIYGLIFSF